MKSPQGSRDFGLTLPFAHLVPDFIVQFYESGLVEDTDRILFAQLDDLRSWLRTGGRQESALAADVAEALIPEDAPAMEAASLEGEDAEASVMAELGALRGDDEEELKDEFLDPGGLRPLLQLMVEEGDSLHAWSSKAFEGDFSASLSFTLSQPLRHSLFKRPQIEAGLKKFGNEALLVKLDQGRVAIEELSGVINLDIYKGEQAPGAVHPKNTGVTQVAMEDCRAGDNTRLALSFHYPLPWEAYFVMVLEAAKKRLNLK